MNGHFGLPLLVRAVCAEVYLTMVAQVAEKYCYPDIRCACKRSIRTGLEAGWPNWGRVRGTGPTKTKEKGMRDVTAAQGLARNAVTMRITVGLISKAARDLRRTQQRSGLGVADILNRAVTLYEFVDSHQAAGDQILLRRGGAGRVERVRLS